MGGDARLVATRATARGIELVVAAGIESQRNAPAPRSQRNAAPLAGLEDLDARLEASGIGEALPARVRAAAAPPRGLPALDAAAASLAAAIPILPPRPTRAGGARVVALVGPTGVGKTTTIAKLAGRLRAQAKRDVAILTFDTYRVGAVEQIANYAG